MNCLTIDTTQEEAAVILHQDGEAAARRFANGPQVGGDLLAQIAASLQEAQLPLAALDRIAVRGGLASTRASSLRAGQVVGTLLAYAAGAQVVDNSSCGFDNAS